MVSNELIGIAGVLAFTFCLIALYHFIGVLGPHRKTYGAYNANMKQIRESHQNRPLDHVLNKSLGKDNAWLLWSPDLDAKDPPKLGFEGRRNKGL